MTRRRGTQTRTKGRSCDGKKAHETWAEANAHVDRPVAKGSLRESLAAYTCKKCGKKHVGHVVER